MDAGTVHLQRELSSWKDSARAYVVVIDGERVGRVANGASASFPLPPGGHEIRLKIDWAGSPTIAFELPPGGTASFVCRATSMGLLGMLKAFVGSKRYIELERTA